MSDPNSLHVTTEYIEPFVFTFVRYILTDLKPGGEYALMKLI